MLGVRMNPEWKFVGTDISKTSLDFAQKNVGMNGLSGSIELRLQTNPEHIFKGILRMEERFTFSMCNPPFFSDASEACQNPNGTCTASDHEAVTDGGEETFVGKMISESIEMPDKVIWWTSMLGRKKSLKPLARSLQRAPFHPKVVTAEFVQGKTTRWAIAWSFSSCHDDSLCGAPKTKKSKVISSSPVTIFSSTSPLDLSSVRETIERWSKERGHSYNVFDTNTVSCTLCVEDGSDVDIELSVSDKSPKALVMRVVSSGNEDPDKLLEKHFKYLTQTMCDLAKVFK